MDRRIAIVGIGARLPGGRGPAGVWRMLQRRDTAIGTAPESRAPFLTDHDITDSGFETVCRTGGFIDGWDEFDYSAFGISAREAEVMDPQQRIVLETAFEAIGDAGFTLDYLQRRSTGVVSGYITRDYWHSARHDAGLDAMSNVGNTGSGLSGRLSHVFGLTGPALTIDTACSSGLAAVAVAIDNLLVGNCSIAVATATNLVLDPYETLSFHRSGMLADDSRCKFGTTHADGFVRSDGFAAVVLRPLEDALAEGDRIYAVIEAVATGNDGGRSGSLPTPSVEGQIDVIRRALSLAGRAPSEVSYVEAHGTGTTVGDQVELDGLTAVFGDRERPLPIGSVKTRIGHCEAASGMAGLVVAALSLHYATVPPMLAHGELRDELSSAERGLFAQVGGSLPLPEDAVIGVSSFGITGTNAHAVLVAPPRPKDTALQSLPSLPRLTSAGVALPAVHDADDSERIDTALAYRVNHTTEQRQADADAERALTTLGTGLVAGLWRETPKVVFAFGGFGAHWLDPATTGDPLLREYLHTAYTAVRTHMAEHERSVMDGGPDIPAALQPYATWASQLAIAFTLREYGVTPDAVLGHSFGDIAAACVAGALDLDAAARLLAARTEAVRTHSGNTRMIVITGEDVARDRDWIPPTADVAVVNSPSCVVLACPGDAIEAIAESALAHGHEARALEVVFGSHSRFVEAALPEFATATALDEGCAADVPFYSSSSTAAATPQSFVARQHWLDNLRAPVELPPVAACLAEDGYEVIVDIGPRAVLAGHLRAQFTGTVLATDALDGGDFLRTTLGALFTANVPLRPKHLPQWTSELATALAWKHAPRRVPSLRPAARATTAPAPLVSRAAESVTYRLSGPQLQVVAGHQVRAETVAPGTLTLSYIVRTLHRADLPLRIDSVRFVEAIVLDDETEQLALTVSRTGNQVEVHFTTDPAAAPVLCCTATVAPVDAITATPTIDLPFNLSPLPVAEFYRAFDAAGNLWNGPFRSIAELWASTSHACVVSELDSITAGLDDSTPIGGEIDPALFDAALHGLAAVHYGLTDGGEAHSPFYFEGVDRMTFYQPRLRGYARSIIAPSGTGSGFDIAILDADDRLAIRCEGVRIRPLESRSPIPALHRVWAPLTSAFERGEQRVVDLFDLLGGEVPGAAVASAADAGHELLIDARTPSDDPTATLTDYLAGLGQALTGLARTAAEANVPLGLVVDDIEHPPADEFTGAVTGFLLALAGALPYEFPTLGVAVISTAAGRPLGELPSIRELSERGEHRVRRDGVGNLWAARLSEQPPRSRPHYSHPTDRNLDDWSAQVRLHSNRACDIEVVWSDPNHGPRGIGIRPMPQRYGQARRLPDVLWAADRAMLTPPEHAPTGAWPRALGYRTDPTDAETALLGHTDSGERRTGRTQAAAEPRRAALIVGGNGGLGSALAADLAARAFDEIILVGTRESTGAEGSFDYLRCDIGEESAVELLEERLSRVDADELFLFHLAGRLSTGPLTELGRSDWVRVLTPKVDGTRHLVEIARRTNAHMLVAYSSASAVLPSPQFAHYGAANAAMEGILAAADGVRVRGVRWGFWAGAGMLRDLDPTRTFTPAGVGEIGAAEGHTFLWNVLSTPNTDLPVCYPADWAEFGGRYQVLRRDALLHELRPSSGGETRSAPVESVTATPVEQIDPMESLIMTTLKITDVSVVRNANRLRAIGLDSLLAVELRTKIKSAFGRTVPVRTLLGPITPTQLHALVTDADAPSERMDNRHAG
ncbi:SDR family NAD(P)-dependent oxidoreductase [Nocardia sp. SYP-A9097]|uniref:type I polyketide synthase n=1 Tax=Nocardia sp. SYP-A9097 TaxID=2663237 RepID=UPI00129B2FC8|nr:type I polyketide synthase [Nocardia sp. SYP-A9097]MRH88595.1 SDR family NAD(P)-dependent oxidoreductase [Nocardia sp. SYP-A9097]